MRDQGIAVPLDEAQADVLMVTSVIGVLLYQDARMATAKILNHLGVKWTLRSDGFEGANFGLLAGSEALQHEASQRLIDEALAIGAKTVLVPGCGHAYPALRCEARLADVQPLPFEVMAVAEYVGQQIGCVNLQLLPGDPARRITHHDACKLVRHGGVVTEPRT